MWLYRLKAGRGIYYLPDSEEEYIGFQKEKKLWIRGFGVFVGCFLMYYGVRIQKYYICVFGLALVLASTMFKDMAVHDKGIEIRYLMPFWHFESLWTWDVVTHVAIDHVKHRPYIGLHFGRDTVHRIVAVEKGDVPHIKELVRRHNPNVKIVDMLD